MTRPALPNSPLIEVSAELRFQGDLSLYERWGAVQRDLKGEFPKLLVPPAEQGRPPMLQPVHLASGDNSRTVMLAVNSFAFSWRRYGDFPTFLADFTRALRVFEEHAEPVIPTRFGLRYTNLLPLEFPAPSVPGRLHPCVRLSVAGWEPMPAKFTDPPLVVVAGSVGDINLRVSLLPPIAVMGSTTVQLQGGPDGLILDLDAGQAQPGSAKDFEGFLHKAHDLLEDTFFGLLTEEYLGYLRGAT